MGSNLDRRANGEMAQGASRPPAPPYNAAAQPVVVATIMRARGSTGVQTHVTEFASFLEQSGRPCHIVTPFSWGGVLRAPAFGPRLPLSVVAPELAVRWYRYWHFVFLREALRRYLASCGPVTVYAQCPVAALAALQARRARSQAVVMVVHFMQSQADEWVDKRLIRLNGTTYRRIKVLEHRVASSVDGVIFVSDAARRSFIAGHPGMTDADLPPHTAVIPNFVAPQDRGASPDPGVGGPADLISVGSLELCKNHAYLLDVLAEAKRLGHRYSLNIVGNGPTHKDLVRRTRALGLQDQVRFLGSQPCARALLPGHLAYVHASKREALCVSIIEALAAGLPVLAATAGGVPELMDSGVEGDFWPLDDPETAARILIDVVSDEDRRRAMGAAARHRARAFAPSVQAVRLEQFLIGCSASAASAGGAPVDPPGRVPAA